MNNLDSRLIELNQALLGLKNWKTVDSNLVSPSYVRQYVDHSIDLGPGNDTVVINQGSNCNETGYTGSQGVIGFTGSQGATGPQGFTGSQGQTGATGETGDRGEQGPIGYTGSAGSSSGKCQAILVSQDYTAQVDDYYIGVNSTGATVITLPTSAPSCQQIIVKAEMGPPLGNRKVTIHPGSSTIDGETEYVMTVPWESVTLFYRDGNWYVV